ncbi:hybrid sensor histidine kinase/response regulator [Pelosinus sp. UFO1]|uniref:hybrid sensor histidine kinase/response regulator n=1 Tax=Pelosinus sp. UFO1 TaxID=484770 RepID=UPI0004D0C7E3|nr:hybrid sensor histidine kinase/response regulator [Pelosinus sp. UFO1]AIF53364.1 CheA signal transduction histidine kinase [Pelosinus sp. UFO1]
MLKDEKLIQEFVIEAISHVEKIESGLLAIEKGQLDEQIIHSIFRSAHNIKGTAGFFGFHKIVELSHAIESLLGKVRSREIAITLPIIDALLAANDELKVLLDHITTSEQQDITIYVKELKQAFPSESFGMNGKGTTSSLTSEMQETISQTNKPYNDVKVVLEDLSRKGHRVYKYQYDIHSIEPNEAGRLCGNTAKSIQSIGVLLAHYITQAQEGTRSASQQEAIFLFSTVLEKELAVMALGASQEDIVEFDVSSQKNEIFQVIDAPNKTGSSGYNLLEAERSEFDSGEEKRSSQDLDTERIKVDVTLLNNLVNLASEMVLARNQLLRALEKEIDSIPGIRPILQKIDHTTTEIQEKIMRTRMQPVSILFQPIPRLVRELSKKLGKNLTLRMEGKEVEMDKSILEGLVDPFTHLIRNALDHGIEDAALRKSLGKDPTATLEIQARHEGGRVIIDIRDDGAGINVEKIRQQALKQGLIHQEQGKFMSESKVLDYIFSPGLSTVSKVSDISGRGVGLDVVRSNIEKFGGTVEVYTIKGQGTTFRLLLPLTLAIIPSLIVGVENHFFALPQTHLQEIVRVVEDKDIGKIQSIQGQQVLWLRGKLVPIIHLAEVIGLNLSEKHNKRITRILIIKVKENIFGLIVDTIHGREEILVKPMPTHLRDRKVYSGVTILGDGSIAMVLDATGIAETALMFTEEEATNSQIELAAVESKREHLQKLLLFHCFGPETFALHLSMVARVNEIRCHQIERIGDKEFYHFQGNIVELIRPEKHLPVAYQDNVGEKMYVIHPKFVTESVGILVRKIQDTVESDLLMTEDDIQAKGLLGSTVVNGKIVLLMDLYELLEMAVPQQEIPWENNQLQKVTKNVLLVEDTPFFIRLVKKYLGYAGYQVFVVQNGREALRFLRQQSIDVVITALDMPLVDSMEMLQRIRVDENLAEIPVIVVSDESQNEIQKKAMLKAGFNSYGCKFDRRDLLEKVAAVQLEDA